MSEDLDRRLKDYLDREESERDAGITKAAILGMLQRHTDWMADHDKQDAERFAAHQGQIDQHHWRLGSLDGRVAKVEGQADKLAEDTGRHQIVVAERRAEGPIKVLLAIMGSALAVLGAVLVWALTRR
jgi:hypothetical protein